MSFEDELNTLLEYCDYDQNTVSRLASELKMVHEIYPGLSPNRGWGNNLHDHTISLTGYLIVDYNKVPIKVPFGISYPIGYPQKPPICSIITKKNHLIMTNNSIDGLGNIQTPCIKTWNFNRDSFEVLEECYDIISKTKPWYNLEDVFLHELWRLRIQIEDLNKDRISLKNSVEEIIKMDEELDQICSEEKLQMINAKVNNLENWINGQDMNFDLEKLIEFKRPEGKQLLNVMAEIEAIDEVLGRLEEAFFMKAIQSNDYILTIKMLYKDRFLLNKMKEKINSLLR